MHRGYIRLWRKIEDSFLMLDSQAFHLFTTLLFRANHADKDMIFNGKKLKIKRGQTVTGRFKLSEQTNISDSKIYRLLKMFEREQLIKQQTNNAFTVITILNYTEYQQSEQQSEQRVNNGRTTSEQRVNTNNNYKELISTKKKALTDEEFLRSLKTTYDYINIDREMKKINGWLMAHSGRQKTRRFIINWLNKIDKPIVAKQPAPIKVKDFEPVSKEEQEEVRKMIHETALKMPVAK